VEIGGHPPIPLAQNKGFHLGSFSTYFWVLNFWGHFEAINSIFWARHSHTIGIIQRVMKKFDSSDKPFQWAIMCPKQRLYAKVIPVGS
jgi:hypothetical protein